MTSGIHKATREIHAIVQFQNARAHLKTRLVSNRVARETRVQATAIDHHPATKSRRVKHQILSQISNLSNSWVSSKRTTTQACSKIVQMKLIRTSTVNSKWLSTKETAVYLWSRPNLNLARSKQGVGSNLKLRPKGLSLIKQSLWLATLTCRVSRRLVFELAQLRVRDTRSNITSRWFRRKQRRHMISTRGISWQIRLAALQTIQELNERQTLNSIKTRAAASKASLFKVSFHEANYHKEIKMCLNLSRFLAATHSIHKAPARNKINQLKAMQLSTANIQGRQ